MTEVTEVMEVMEVAPRSRGASGAHLVDSASDRLPRRSPLHFQRLPDGHHTSQVILCSHLEPHFRCESHTLRTLRHNFAIRLPASYPPARSPRQPRRPSAATPPKRTAPLR